MPSGCGWRLAGGAVIAFAAREAATGTIAVIALMVGVSGLAWALLARGHRLTRAESVALIVLYGLTLPLLAGYA